MRVLLTGSSGYIGSNLVQHLKAQGHGVVGFDRRAPMSEALDACFEADLLDADALKDALGGVDAVLHLAAAKGDWGISAAQYFRDNVETTRALLRAGRARGVRRWVFYSSVACLGPSDEPLDELAPISPVIPYGASKARAETLFREFSLENPDAGILIIRPSAVFGPGNLSDSNIGRLIDAIHRGRFVMIGDGSQVKTTSYIENLLAAHMFLMERMRPGIQTYIYVDAPPLTTEDLVSRLYHLLGKRRPSWRLPLGLVKPLARTGDAVAAVIGRDLPITMARIQKFCTGTNFSPCRIHRLGFRQPVSIEDALEATVAWYLTSNA
jgi:GlcNAc-P-P-Und epimerase